MAVWIDKGVPDGEVVAEVHGEDVDASFPGGVLGSWYFAVPFEHVCGFVLIFHGFGDETEGVIAAPLFALFFESVDDEFADFFFALHRYRL